MCHSDAVPDTTVVELAEQLDNPRAVVSMHEQQEPETHHGGATHIVVYFRDGDVKQFLDSLVVPSAAVGHVDSVHATSSQNGVIVLGQARDEKICLLQAPLHNEVDPHSQCTQDFLVLSLLSVGNHVLNRRSGLASQLH